MIHTAERRRASLPRAGAALAAIVALAVSLFAVVQPASADHVDGNRVWLHQDLGSGVASTDPGEFAGECERVGEGEVLFHFVANKLAEGTTSATLTAMIEGMGEVTVDGYFPGEGEATLHFDLILNASATLTDAYADFNVAQTEATMLLLSHVCDRANGGASPSASESVSASQSAAPSESVPASVSPTQSASAAPATETDVMVMKHVCPDSVQSQADFDNLDTFSGDPAGSFLDKVLACPVITMPGDAGPAGALDADDPFFDQFVADGETAFNFTVTGTAGTQNLVDDGSFIAAQVCESDLGLELDGDATTDVCVEISHYMVGGVTEGPVTITESQPPDGFRFGAIEFTPDSGDADTLVTAADGTIVLDTTGDDDDSVMVHVYNFANVADESVSPTQSASASAEGDVRGGQGGPGGGLPNTSTSDDSSPFGLPLLLGAIALAALGGLGAVNLRMLRHRVD